jgi:putative heme iron utilization protein
MKPVEHFDAVRLARTLLRRRREGALATLMAGSGDPYCSLVNLASQPNGAPILLISRLALHTQNILADPRVSLMLDERGPKDPLQGARIMVAGTAREAAGAAAEVSQRRYLAAHPAAGGFLKFKDFSFFEIAIQQIHLVAGFGRIIDLTPDQVLTDLRGAEALVAAEAEICTHLNTDHREALALYATRLIGAKAARWRCSGCDPDGLDLQSRATTLRLDFPHRVKTPAALRQMLKRLAAQARAA